MRRLAARIGRAALGPPGWLCGALTPRWRGQRRVFCFFATPAIGGAELVHAQIVEAVADASPVVFFTEPPRDAGMLGLYTRQKQAEIHMLAPRGRNRAREYFNEARIAAEINRAENPVVFGAFSHFFYRLLPRLRPEVRTVDLIHNFGIEFENFSIPYVPCLDARVVLAESFVRDFAALYDAFGLAPFTPRMRVIANAIEMPPPPPPKPEGPLRVLFVGRDAPEKRVHLVGRVARKLRESGVEAEFTLAGADASALDEADRTHCKCLGMVSDRAQIADLQEKAHVLLLTSSREGLPMVMLEGMARGCVPVVTAVGGIPEHIAEGRNGVLLPVEPEQETVDAAVRALTRMAGHRGMLKAMGEAARAWAVDRFGMGRFRREWRDVLVGA